MPYNIDETITVGDPAHVQHHIDLADAVNDLDLRAYPPKFMPYRSGDWLLPQGLNTTPGMVYLADATIHGCPVYIGQACSVVSAKVYVGVASGVGGATMDLVLYKASDESLVGTFGSIAIDSTGYKTATPGSPIAVTSPGWYIAAYRLRTTVGVVPQVGGYKAIGTGFSNRGYNDWGYPPEDHLQWTVSGTGAAPASLTSYSRSTAGLAASSPVIMLAVAP